MRPLSFARRPPTRASLALAVVLAALTAFLLVTGSGQRAQAAGSLTQVSNFGANPGALQMYDYIPASAQPNAPLVVALHGCTQQASDYYNDSGWPKYADLWGFDLVFPQQTTANNSLECFDWFTASDDTRGNGEASSIIHMVQYMQAHYSIDASRIYITGLSAGGGMTADLLADYPDVFAAGSVDSGLPAQCATGGSSTASTCQSGAVNKTVAQWAALAANSDPGYGGPWPRVAIWQGTSDYTVSTANSTELMDQWTGVWGISQTPSSTASLPGGTSESVYNDASGKPAVEVYAISGMGHGLAVNPGSGTTQCGATGAYFLNYICSTYYTAVFWGLNGSGSGSSSSASASPSASASASPSSSPTPSSTWSPKCFTESNYQQTLDGHAYQSGGYAYADGSNQNLGLWNVFTVHTLEETSPGYYVIADGHCP